MAIVGVDARHRPGLTSDELVELVKLRRDKRLIELENGILTRAAACIVHSEMNHSRTEPVHFVQMWVVPDTTGIPSGYEQRDLNPALDAGGLVPVASGQGHEGAIAINQAGAVMYVARLNAGEQATIPDVPFVHVFVARGAVTLDGQDLVAGDAARLAAAGEVEVTAGGHLRGDRLDE